MTAPDLDDLAGTDPKRRERFRKAEAAHRAKGNGQDHAAASQARPLISLVGGKLHEHVDDAELALAAATKRDPFTGVYARGPVLTRPVRLAADRTAGGIRRKAGALQLVPVDADYLRLHLTRLVQLQRFDQRKGKWLDTDAPETLARSVIASVPWPQLPPLSGIIEAPTLREDGSLLDRPGYDDATGLLFDPGDAKFPPIPARPSREQAEAALELLEEIFEKFPFTDEASRAVAIAACITGLVRRRLRAAPLFAFSAPKMGCGKTLIATIVGHLVTGRDPPMIGETGDPESERKRLFSLLLDGDPVALLDNVEGKLKSGALCSILTEPMFQDRLLGTNRKAIVATNVMFMATGNNITIAGDLTSRTLLATLDPHCERPEEREFDVDLHQVVSARRGELAAAALTIPLAYLAAGAPKQKVPRFGRFEDWAKWCRDPLIWLGMADPCITRHRIETRDPVREQLRDLLATWHAAFADSAQTVSSVVALQADGEKYTMLRAAIEAIAKHGRDIDPRHLGKFIAQYEGRIEGGLCFARAGTSGNASKWSVSR